MSKKNATLEADGSVTVRFPRSAVIRRYQTSAVLVMPRRRGYDGYRYMVDVKDFRDHDLDGDIECHLCINDAHTLTIRRRGKEAKLTAEEVYRIFNKATLKDFALMEYQFSVPTVTIQGNYPNMVRVRLVKPSQYMGQHLVIPSIFRDEAHSDGFSTTFTVPDYMNFSLRDKNGDDTLENITDLIDKGVI